MHLKGITNLNWHVARRKMQTSVQYQPTSLMTQVTEDNEAMSRAAYVSRKAFYILLDSKTKGKKKSKETDLPDQMHLLDSTQVFICCQVDCIPGNQNLH